MSEKVDIATVHENLAQPRKETEANANLLFDALTVYHETGLTPRELKEQRDELVKAASKALQWIREIKRCVPDWYERMTAIAAAEKGKTNE